MNIDSYKIVQMGVFFYTNIFTCEYVRRSIWNIGFLVSRNVNFAGMGAAK
jgi:hypothetical protein